jgi:hypothetical protein
VAEKRTFVMLSVRTVDGEVRSAYAPSEFQQLYAALLQFALAGFDLMVTDTAPVDYAPILYGVSDADFRGYRFYAVRLIRWLLVLLAGGCPR